MNQTQSDPHRQSPEADTGAGTPSGTGTGTGITLQKPLIVGLLYLLNIFLRFSVFVGLILAYVWRGEEGTQDWERTHYTYLIRTFWIGLAIMAVIGAVWLLMFISMATTGQFSGAGDAEPEVFLTMIIGMILAIVGMIWFCLRAILSIVKAGGQQPMPRPETWLF
ncbi:MAG: hypothetical protein P1U62_12800 [Alteraurantiacibacter sp. bin_em_oilr2.035]|nr:hypothetical protein [Alteraurantiacibacter sp. bin_em_oilr2.035]